jgi:hypothetical protein
MNIPANKWQVSYVGCFITPNKRATVIPRMKIFFPKRTVPSASTRVGGLRGKSVAYLTLWGLLEDGTNGSAKHIQA